MFPMWDKRVRKPKVLKKEKPYKMVWDVYERKSIIGLKNGCLRRSTKVGNQRTSWPAVGSASYSLLSGLPNLGAFS